MANLADLIVRLSLDSSGFKKGLDDAKNNTQQTATEIGKNFTTTGVSLTKIGGIMTAAVSVPLLAAYKQMANAASDYDEQVAKTKQVFGDSAQGVIDWSDTTTQAYGISKSSALTYASTYGNLMSSMGLGKDAAASIQKFVQLAADQVSVL
jgi:hypothetical protein